MFAAMTEDLTYQEAVERYDAAERAGRPSDSCLLSCTLRYDGEWHLCAYPYCDPTSERMVEWHREQLANAEDLL